MAWKPPIRNFEGVQFEKLRTLKLPSGKRFDDIFNQLHDELSDCYYNYWREGKSKPFHGFDVQATKEESKHLFDKLHGLIFYHRDVKFHEANMSLPKKERIPEERYDLVRDKAGNVIDKISDRAQRLIDKLSEKGIEISVRVE